MEKCGISDQARETLRRIAGSRIAFDEPLSEHTGMRVGGAAEALVEVEDEEVLGKLLAFCGAEGIAVFTVGEGSNVIVRDGGWRGVVLRLAGPYFGRIESRGVRIVAGGGASLAAVVGESVRKCLTGLECLAGIPGTVGGATRMNAGAYGSAFGDCVEAARLMDSDGRTVRVPSRDMGFSYRGCRAAEQTVVLDVELKLRSGEMAEIEKKLRWCLERRAEWQPAKPSAGSIFKNPPEGRTAGELIELCGLKGASRGGAAVSARHGNVIVNRGRATARDVIGLMDLISERVRATTGVELEPEVVVVGDEGA